MSCSLGGVSCSHDMDTVDEEDGKDDNSDTIDRSLLSCEEIIADSDQAN